MKNIDEFKDWLKSMRRYERISDSKAEEVLEFVENQQNEIELLKTIKGFLNKDNYGKKAVILNNNGHSHNFKKGTEVIFLGVEDTGMYKFESVETGLWQYVKAENFVWIAC